MIYNFYFASLIFLAGFSLFSALYHLTVDQSSKQRLVQQLFAGITLSIMLSILTAGVSYNTSTVADHITWVRVNMAFTIVSFALLPWFFALYSGVRPKLVLTGSSALCILLFFINLTQPNTLLYTEIHGIDRLLLPWGEEVFLPIATTSIWGYITSAYLLFVPVFAFYLLVKRFRRDRSHSTLSMIFAVALLLASLIQVVIVRVVGIHNLPPLGTFGFLSMVIIMGITLRHELREDRKLAEVALRESECKARAILNQSLQFIGLVSPDGILLDANRAALELVGVTHQDVYNKPFWESPWWNHSVELQKKLRESIKLAAAGQEVRFETSHQSSDGSLRYVDFSLRPVKNDQGDIIYLIPEGHDITEQKLAEKSLVESQRKLSTLMGNLPGLAFRCINNQDWTMMFISDGCFELTGFYPQELEGNQINSYGNLIHRDDAEMVWQKVQEGINKHSFWQIEYRIQTKDGKEKWVWEQGCGVYSDTGELEVLEGFISDITVRKLAEKALLQSHNLLKSTFASLQDAIFIIDLKTTAVIDCNVAASEIFGYSPEEMIGKSTELLHVSMDTLGEFRKHLYAGIAEKGYLHLPEFEMKRKDWTIFPSEHSVTPLVDEQGVQYGWVSVVRDITERKNAEELLYESEEKYRYLVDNAPIGILQRSIHGNFSFCNLTLAKQFECNSIDEFLLNYNDVTKRWASHEQFVEFNELLLNNGEVLGFENKVKLINGKTKWFGLYFKLDSTKSILDGFSLDITERKKAEQAIKESNAYNRQLFSTSKIGLALAKMNGELVDINQAYADIIGYSIEETLQLSYWDITPEKYAEKEQEQLKSLYENDFYGPYEKEYIHKNGSHVPVVLSGNIIQRNGEKYIWSSVEDITDRKKAEAILIKLYTAINSSKASIVITDIDGNIEFANPYFTELTSYSEDEYLGKNPRVLKSGIHSDEYYKALWNTIKSGNTWEGEFCNRKKNGELYWEKSIITPIRNEKEEIINFVAVKSDISHEKKHEHLDEITLEIYEKSEYLSVEEVLKLSIELGIQLTDSEIGFFHFVNEDQETISLQAWSAKTMDMCNVPTLDKHYPISKAGVWVDCFYQKKPVYHNDYSSLSHKKGLPEGHATLTRDLSVPVIVENKIVAIFGVGNKESDYTEIDAEFLSVFAENVWNVVRRKKSEFELIDSKDQIHRFASHLQDVREEEKISIAREIHDDLGQILMALQIDMGLLKNKVVKTISLGESTEILPKVDNIVALIKRSIKTARSIMNDLRPELLELHGLVGAINEYLREFEERYHISCEFNDDIPDIEMTPQQSLALFRILQEAMNNIVKHAKATLVRIQLQNTDNKVVLEITDNGVGFDKKNSGRIDSYGMIGMKERVILLKGELDITSEIGRGTTVKVEIPY
jgi:PAS domain S-box-containing protein